MKNQWFENAVQRDILCPICHSSHWYVLVNGKWYCRGPSSLERGDGDPVSAHEVHRDVLKEIERPQEFRTVSWKKGKNAFGMGWDKKAHEATAPALGV